MNHDSIQPLLYKKNASKGMLSHFPMIEKLFARVGRVPAKYKGLCLFLWVIWKVASTGAILYLASFSISRSTSGVTVSYAGNSCRVLFIMTSLAEYNTGRRSTISNQDRLAEVLVPGLKDSVKSISKSGCQVDVYLILAYELRPEREVYIRQHMPFGVGVEIWDDAVPLNYEKKKSKKGKLAINTRALARQHRYVVRDKFEHYDLFIAMEDDMRMDGGHVQHFLRISETLETMLETARTDITAYNGDLSVRQLERLVPGFVRVEVLLNPNEHGAQKKLDPIPLHYENDSQHFDPSTCCNVDIDSNEFPQEPQQVMPSRPERDNVVIWETNIRALSVKKLPKIDRKTPLTLDWVALLPGPGKRLSKEDLVVGYWSGQEGAFPDLDKKPSGGEPALIAQQGGWVATPKQLLRMDRKLCSGAFLPPFDLPVYRDDGLESFNVEFWSGGYQFFTGVKGGCNMQRIVSLQSSEEFSKHFIYHMANNKQRQLSTERMVRADVLWGQLNTIRKNAIAYEAQKKS